MQITPNISNLIAVFKSYRPTIRLGLVIEDDIEHSRAMMMRVFAKYHFDLESNTPSPDHETWNLRMKISEYLKEQKPRTVQVQYVERKKRHAIWISPVICQPDSFTIPALYVSGFVMSIIAVFVGTLSSSIFAMLGGFFCTTLTMLSLNALWSNDSFAERLIQDAKADVVQRGIRSQTLKSPRFGSGGLPAALYLSTLLSVSYIGILNNPNIPSNSKAFIAIGMPSIVLLGGILATKITKSRSLMHHALLPLASIGTAGFLSFMYLATLPLILFSWFHTHPDYSAAPQGKINIYLGYLVTIVIYIITSTHLISLIQLMNGTVRFHTTMQLDRRDRPARGMTSRLPNFSFLHMTFRISAGLLLVWNFVGFMVSVWLFISSVLWMSSGTLLPLSGRVISAFNTLDERYPITPNPVVVLAIITGLPCLAMISIWGLSIASWMRDRIRYISPRSIDMMSSQWIHNQITALCPDHDIGIRYTRKRNGYVGVQHSGVFRNQSRILIDAKTLLTTLKPDELQAILAHEIAHIINGDCRRRRSLQRFVRLTGLGDSCIGLFENSLKIELEADRTAVDTLGIEAPILASAVEKLSAIQHNCKTSNPGIPATQQRTHIGRFFQGPLWGFRLWYWFYYNGTTMSYWHPTVRERCKILRSQT